MRSRWVAIVALVAMSQALLARGARADTDTDDETETDEESDEASDEAPETGPRVILRIDRPTARLQQRTLLGWRNICIRPCGAIVDPAALYRIGGGGAVISEPFQLPRESGDVFVEGKVGSKAKRIVGIGLLTGGVAAAALTGFMWSVDSQSDQLRDVGVVGIGLCALLAATGIVLISGGRTSLRVR